MKTKEAGVVIMGRRTFQTIGEPLPERLNVIMTHQEAPFDDIAGQLECTNQSPHAVVKSLEVAAIRVPWSSAGAKYSVRFLSTDLVTDMYVTIEPIMFGDGIPLVEGIASKSCNS